MKPKVCNVLLVLAVLGLATGLLAAQSGKPSYHPPQPRQAPRTAVSAITTASGFHAAVLENLPTDPAGIGVSTRGDTLYFTDEGSYMYRDRQHTIKALNTPGYELMPCRMKGSLYVGDLDGSIFRITDDGNVKLLTQVGSDLYITGLDVDPVSGFVYFIAQYEDYPYYWTAVCRVPPEGGEATYLDSWEWEPAWGIAVRGSSVYVADYWYDAVYKHPKNGRGSWTVVATGFDDPTDIQFDKAGNMFVTNYWGGDLAMVKAGTANAVPIVSGLINPYYIQLDRAGTIYLSDSGSGQIYKIWKK